ncbi:hypothetical protein K2W90_05895 [Candidatus Babeliales bacterium]|nr:hypothetical protein [Candidatus Babeliales bacterium]
MEAKTDFFDIYDYVYQPVWQTTPFKIGSGIVAGLLLVALILLIIYLRRKKKQISPWEWALREIANISIDKCIKKSDFKKVYFQLTDILKQYFQKRYGWQTINKTDDELIGYLSTQKFDYVLLTELQKMLEGSLWVKFANQEMLKTQAQKDLKTALRVIEETRPQENANKK